MLREWLQNVSLSLIDAIVADQTVTGRAIWTLAKGEQDRRRKALAA